MRTARRCCIFLFIFLLLSGCGGGGGQEPPPTGQPDTPEKPDNPNRDTEPDKGIVSGIAFDAPISEGDVAVYDFSAGKKGEQLAAAVTGGEGLYQLELATTDKPKTRIPP